MNVAETLLVFAGAPLAVIAVLAALIFLPRGRSRRPRYKPGQPWGHAPVWYEPHPEGGAGGHGGGYGAAVHGDDTLAIGSSVYGEPTDGHRPAYGAASSAHGAASSAQGATSSAQGATSSAHGASSSAHGASSSAHGATSVAAARPPVPAGPLGGARGTW